MSETAAENDKFAGWVILELMGHRRLTGYLSEQEIAGRAFLRIDVPSDPPATQFYGSEAVYCITPTTEEMARAAANLGKVAPVQRWELPSAAWRPVGEAEDDHGSDDDDQDVTGSEFDGSGEYAPAF